MGPRKDIADLLVEEEGLDCMAIDGCNLFLWVDLFGVPVGNLVDIPTCTKICVHFISEEFAYYSADHIVVTKT
jgi:hypothetical protein